MLTKHIATIILLFLSFFISRPAHADDDYAIGNPTLKVIWVDPVNGSDRPDRGSTRALALKTVTEAWNLIPQGAILNNEGFQIMLAPGVYSIDNVPSIFQSVWGTSDNPVIFQAADDTGAVVFPSIDVTLCKYLYMIGIRFIASQSSYVSDFVACDHVLLRSCQFLAADSTSANSASLGVIFNQCQHIYFEHSEIANSSGRAIDLYATQYGHIKDCSVHHYGENGISLAGGTAYFSVEENTIHHGGSGGIACWTRDTTRGLDNMISPWVHYEIYDIKCYNNIIHHTAGAGFSCSGGYNILFAFNTLYQTGLTNSLVKLGTAIRACAIDRDIGHALIDSGAWGTWYWYLNGLDSDSAPIPNKNIFIYNNIFANTPDSATASSHFTILGPVTAAAFNASCPRPALADDNLKIRGNIIWNGAAGKSLGITPTSGCGSSNPSCNQTQLEDDNLVNAAEPQFVNDSLGNFHPKRGSIVFTIAKTFPVPVFSWTGLPPAPQEPQGNTSNRIPVDKDSNLRNLNFPIAGAFDISISSVADQMLSQEDVSLLQNYPNPASGVTTIGFHLAARKHVVIEIYDLLGTKMKTLSSSAMDEGDHYVDWNTSSVPSGKYFYRIETENMTATKQMTVVR
jgi:hypothetical protein